MTEPNTTSTPWVYHSGSIWKPAEHNQFPDGTENGMPIARMDREPGNGIAPDERDANAKLIVKAVNNYRNLISIAYRVGTISLRPDCPKRYSAADLYDGG